MLIIFIERPRSSLSDLISKYDGEDEGGLQRGSERGDPSSRSGSISLSGSPRRRFQLMRSASESGWSLNIFVPAVPL